MTDRSTAVPELPNRNARRSIRSVGTGLWSIFRFMLLFGLAFLILEPFFTKIIMALMSPDDLLDPSVNLIPKHLSTYYWQVALEGIELSKTLLNSLALSVLVAGVELFTSALVGYGLARFRFRGRRLLFAMVILIMLVPSQTYSIAQYLNFRYPFGLNLSTIDTLIPMFAMALGGMGFKQGLYIYLFMTFFRGLPQNLEDAAFIDGAGNFRTFWSVILPNSRSVIVTVLLFSFSWQWTDTSYAQLYFTRLKVIPAMIGSIYVRVGLTADTIGTAIAQNAACMLLILPLLLLFVLGQRSLTQSIARSGMAN